MISKYSYVSLSISKAVLAPLRNTYELHLTGYRRIAKLKEDNFSEKSLLSSSFLCKRDRSHKSVVRIFFRQVKKLPDFILKSLFWFFPCKFSKILNLSVSKFPNSKLCKKSASPDLFMKALVSSFKIYKSYPNMFEFFLKPTWGSFSNLNNKINSQAEIGTFCSLNQLQGIISGAVKFFCFIKFHKIVQN